MNKNHVKKNLKNRVEKARAAARFASVSTRDAAGKAKTINVPGSEARIRNVILWRKSYDNKPVMMTECDVVTGIGRTPCKGNQHVCYHSMAAVIAAAQDKGMEVNFCDNPSDAEKLNNIKHGVVIPVVNKRDTDSLWAVVYKKS